MTERSSPDGFEAVHRWLGDRPEATPTGSKNYVWSFIAGWYADHGVEAFLRELWHDEDLKAHLEQMLTECGATASIEAIEGRGAH